MGAVIFYKKIIRRYDRCLDDVPKTNKVDSILVDGNHFHTYLTKNNDSHIPHKCIIKGDNVYKSIAAAIF